MGMGRFRNVLNSAASALKGGKKSDVAVAVSLPILEQDGVEKVKKMLEQGADLNAKDANGNTLLHLAISKNNIELADYLLGVCDTNARNAAGETPLILAVKLGRLELIDELIEKHPDLLTQPDSRGNLLLHEAGRYGQVEIVHALLKRLEQQSIEELSVSARNRAGETLLHLAARGGFLQLVHDLVKLGAEIGISDYERNTPLHLAALGGHEKVISFLIEYLLKHFEAQQQGSEYEELANYVNAQNKAGNTPLHLAVLRGHKEAAYALARTGHADTTIQNEEKETALNLTDDPAFQKDLSILSKTTSSTEEGILTNKNVSDSLGAYLEMLKQEKLENE